MNKVKFCVCCDSSDNRYVNYERGALGNACARLGMHLVNLREELPRIEKLARKTPPKTLVAEIAKVKAAKARLPVLQAEISTIEREHANMQADIDALHEFSAKLRGISPRQ